MNTILVWVLMTVSHSGAMLSYSPMVADLASCERMQQATRNTLIDFTKCVQISAIK